MNLLSTLLRPAALCLLLLAGLAQATPTPNAPAPDFTLRTAEGRNLRLQEQRGQVVMLNFWATWCGPCREEMPQLGKLYERYQGAGFQLLGVNVDEDPAAAAALAQKLGVKFPVLLDSAKQVSKLYELNSMPSTVLIDRDGKVRFLHRGYRAGVEQTYDQQIRTLLKE
ncbi:TlpA family protein disulfide reductase [Ideonella azotifigens]|uniref:Thioredoxin domain-containing protein n=1 Tax=Ideonella azotifigens TaxID=513160 RepID=A0ABN1KF63_9BURK|nr:TlpA disulfide reductase family protein [Ideonella azotifigens]MCD2340729.1 TlpA family protein disulfide reductase [Ideonella azotifigens]